MEKSVKRRRALHGACIGGDGYLGIKKNPHRGAGSAWKKDNENEAFA
jgi:hypothetical protein